MAKSQYRLLCEHEPGLEFAKTELGAEFISTVGCEAIITPSGYWQRVHSEVRFDNDCPALPPAFAVRILERFDEEGHCIGVSGRIFNGPDYLVGLVANCFARFDGEVWDEVSWTYANLLISPEKARRHPQFSHQHVDGATCSRYPQFRGVCEIYVSKKALPKSPLCDGPVIS